MTATQPRISVIVPTYNRSALLRHTLESLLGQTLGRDEFDVVVSDDGSTDDTAEVAESFSDRLNLRYRHQEDRGFRVARARNEGARLAGAPVLVFLDSGVMAGPDLLASYLAAHAETPGTVLLGYTYGYQPFHPTEGLAEAIASSDVVAVHNRFHAEPGFRDLRHEQWAAVDFDLSPLHVPWMFLWSLNFSVSAADYWAVGGFDEAFTSYGTEDVELGFRLFRHGTHIRLNRQAWAVENPHDRDIETLVASCRKTMRQFLDKSHVPEVEVVWAVLENRLPRHFEEHYGELLGRMEEAREYDVRAEIEQAFENAGPSARLCVVGCGGEVADRPGSTVLVDYDASLLGKLSAPGRTTVHAVGLDLPLADRSVDVVVLTSRLAVLGPDWADTLHAEAQRVGAEVHDFAFGRAGRGRPDGLC